MTLQSPSHIISSIFVTLFVFIFVISIDHAHAGTFDYDPVNTSLCEDQSDAYTVGPNGDFETIHDAFRNTKAGDKIALKPIVYGHLGNQRINLLKHDLTICGNGAIIEPSQGWVAKGLITTKLGDSNGNPLKLNLYIEDVTFRNAENSAKNGAGIRMQGDPSVTCVNCKFINNQDGILGGGETGEVRVIDSVFEHNGSNGFAHAIYQNGGGTSKLIVENSTFTDTLRGMHVKSLAGLTIVKNSFFDDWTDKYADDKTNRASRVIEVTHGGDVLAEGNTIFKDPQAENKDIFFYTVARGGSPGEILIRDNDITISHPNGRMIRNTTGAINTFLNNTITSDLAPFFGEGLIKISTGNTWNGEVVNPLSVIDYARIHNGAIVGTGANDILVGSTGKNTIVGGDGNDSIYGNKNDDKLFGGDGNDIIYTGNRADTISGGNGNDVIVVDGGGNKGISTGEGDDVIVIIGKNKGKTTCGPGQDTVVLTGKHTEVVKSRPHGKNRWVVHPKDGFDNILASCEKLQFEDGTFDIETQIFSNGIFPVNISAYYPVTYPTNTVPVEEEGAAPEPDTEILTIKRVKIEGPFKSTTNCGALKPGTFCHIDISFSPKTVGGHTGKLTLTHNESNAPIEIGLVGFGVQTEDNVGDEEPGDDTTEEDEVPESPPETPAGDEPIDGDAQLMGYWKFDETGEVIVDSSKNNHNGTISGNPEKVPGVFGSALLFKATGDKVTFGNSSDFNFGTRNYSACMWLKSKQTKWFQILGDKQGRSNGWIFAKSGGKNGMSLRFFEKGVRSGKSYAGAKNHIINDGSWHHICFTANRTSELTFYKDGKAVDTTNISASKNVVIENDAELCVGQCFNGNLNATVDDLRIYHGLLSSNEVEDIYRNGLNALSLNESQSFSTRLASTMKKIAFDVIDLSKRLVRNVRGTIAGALVSIEIFNEKINFSNQEVGKTSDSRRIYVHYTNEENIEIRETSQR